MTKKFTPPQFVKALQRARDNVKRDGLRKAALAGGFVIEGYGKVNAMTTFNNVTGNLANSIQTQLVSATAKRAETHVGPTAIYGRIQELGGTIFPRNATRLHWVDEEGKHHSAVSVTLPARPYMEPAVTEHVPDIAGAVAESIRQTVEGSI